MNPSLLVGVINHLEPKVLVYQRYPAFPDQRRLGAVEYMIINSTEVEDKNG